MKVALNNMPDDYLDNTGEQQGLTNYLFDIIDKYYAHFL